MVVDAENLQSVFDDDVLHCVCSHLCCDRQVVHVNGSHSFSPEGVEDNIIHLLDGHARHYGLHLELRPLSGRCQLQVAIEDDRAADLSATGDPVVVDLQRQIAILKNIHGVIFRDFDFQINITINCTSGDSNLLSFRVQSLLECVTGCSGSAFVNCTASITVQVRNLNTPQPRHFHTYTFPPEEKEEPRLPGWSSGGGGGGGGGVTGGGGYGPVPWQGDEYAWPETDEDGEASEEQEGEEEKKEDWLPFGDLDVIIRAIAFHNCPRAVFARGCRAMVDIAIQSHAGAESEAVGWHNCGGWHNQRSSGKIVNTLTITGVGQAYTVDDGSHGVFPYSVTARADSRLLSASGGGHTSELTGSASAIARATATNQPYHTTADGVTSHGQVGGASQALAFGAISNQGGQITAANITCVARATHPTSHAALAVPYRANTATLQDCAGSEPYCDSNLSGWCAANL
jgi:hypothetical protein